MSATPLAPERWVMRSSGTSWGATVETYPSREDWLAARSQGLGASDAAAVLGCSPWRSPLALYTEKLGLALDDEAGESEAMAWGLALEPLIAEHYSRETGRTLQPARPWTIHRSPQHLWLIASLDRVIEPHDSAPAAGPGVLEVKTTSRFRADDWDPEPPLHYQIQVQHQLAVTGWQWGSLAVLVGGQKFLWTDVTRNEAFIARLLEAEAAFWGRLERHDPPPIDAQASSRTALGALFPRESPEAKVALPQEADAWDAQRQEACAQLDHWMAQKTEAENHLKALIGEAAIGLLPSGVRYTWKTQTRKSYVVPASTSRVLRRSGGAA